MIFNYKFANYLFKKGVLDAQSIKVNLKSADSCGVPIYEEILKNKIADEEVIYRALADFFELPYHDFILTEVDFELIKRFDREKMIENRCVPYMEDEESITFCVSNPFKIEDVQEFKLYTGKKLVFSITSPSQLDRVISYVDNKIQQDTVLDEYSDASTDITERPESKEDVAIDAPIIKLCDSILKDAVSRGASDIHIEPFDDEVVLRFRIDGRLLVIDRLAKHLYPSLLARYKIMSGMNIAERRVPQDGKINQSIDNVPYDFRVSTIPTINGEKIVIRIYNVTFASSDLDVLGFSKAQEKLVLEMLSKPHGILLLTGPTGSGKSTTLYAFLRFLNKEDTNIMTVEDPVENKIVGINQVQVNPKAELTFAAALRSFLRQDPNVIMVGEIRDEETAQIATRAAITGHLVLSTIHTNDAAGVVTRLINMGIPKYLVADSLIGSISQRLVRKLCPHCKKKHLTTPEEQEILGIDHQAKIYEAVGCKMCSNTGYIGRVGVFEIMALNLEIRETIMSDDFSSLKLDENLKGKMPYLLDHARERVLNGETSIEEYVKLNDVVHVQ